mmetsp:Transcript_21892/g.40853  ORF Transcript_21892/g.40853 Transcript_21892/m.40853 type:complete len:171 (+) Transcript_21892:58-570(+)|eukprot:CAMPEP_0178775502 /NCGR_PEP_ID=MMETSP0744-20121128/24229_1 /TAXON_ID=913974 /ORGANISM="Nitzschia punctata, Strain CCMP561" /LENGTH=170 /DNA_ID=CAMNT_0020432489 /DNA_START=664 /DNA_END=1176 /DNA_ORIENTATION=+
MKKQQLILMTFWFIVVAAMFVSTATGAGTPRLRRRETQVLVFSDSASCPCWNEQVLGALFPSIASLRLTVGRHGTPDGFDLPTFRMETCQTEAKIAITTVNDRDDNGAHYQCIYAPDTRFPIHQLRGTPLEDVEYDACVELLKEHFQTKLGGRVLRDENGNPSWDFYKQC